MGCDFFGGDGARGEGVVVWTGLDCDFWDFGRWAVICVVRALGAWGGSCCL